MYRGGDAFRKFQISCVLLYRTQNIEFVILNLIFPKKVLRQGPAISYRMLVSSYPPTPLLHVLFCIMLCFILYYVMFYFVIVSFVFIDPLIFLQSVMIGRL